MNIYQRVCAGLFLALTSLHASATLTTWTAQGTVLIAYSNSTVLFNKTVQVGDSFSLSWTFDSSTPVGGGDGVTNASYFGAIASTSFTVGGVTETYSPTSSRLSYGIGGAYMVYPPGALFYSDNLNGAWNNGYEWTGFEIDSGSYKLPPNILKSVSLTAPPPDVSNFTTNTPFLGTSRLQVSLGLTNVGPALVGTISALTQTGPVPEPESWIMLLAGLCAVGATVRHRSAR